MLKRSIRLYGDKVPWLGVAAFGAILLGGCALGQYNYLLFHTLTEILSFVLACIVFAVFWNTRRIHDSGFYLFIAIACLAGSSLDLLHALSYKGITFIPGATPDNSIQLKTAGRWIVGISFVVAPFLLSKKINPQTVLANFAGIVSFVLLMIFFWDMFPTGYILSSGMTLFQQVCRGISCIVFLGAVVALTHQRKKLSPIIYRYLLASQIACFFSEFASAISTDFMGSIKIVSHLFSLAFFFFLYKAFVEWGIRNPSETIFQNMARTTTSIRRDRDFMDTLLQSMCALVVVFDSRGRVIRFNRTCESISGYSFDEIAENDFWGALLPPEEREEVRLLINEHLAGRSHSRHDNHWIHKDGSRRLISWSNANIVDDEGKVKYVICTGLDNTELKDALNALERESLRYKAIMEASLDGIYVIDSKGRLLECNGTFLRNLGYTREEAQHLRINDWNAEWQGLNAMKEVRTRIGQGAIFETVHRRKDGSLMSVEVNATSMMLDGEERIYQSVRDISERKLVKQELREKDRRLQLFAENFEDILWLMDLNGRFFYVSPSVKKKFGYDPEAFLDLPFDRFMTPTSAEKAARKLIDVLAQARLGHAVEPDRLELEFFRSDGALLWGEATYTGMYDDAGKLLCLQGVTRDITERRRAEQSLRESEEKYRLFFEESTQGIILIDFDAKRIDFANPAFCRMLGYSEEELKELPLTDLHPPKNRMLADSIYDSLLLTENISTMPIPMQRKNGETLHAELSGVMVRLKERKYGVCFFTDVTQRKRAEQKLESAMKRLEGLYFLQEMLTLPSSLEEKFQLIADSAAAQLELDFCRIWMARPGDFCDSGCIHFVTDGTASFCPHRARCLHLLADSRRDAGLDADYPRMPLDRSPISQIVAGEKNKFLADNVADDSRIDDPAWANRYGTAAFAGYKLSNALNESIGVLEASRGNYFTEEDDAFLEDLAKKATQIVIDFSKEEELRQSQKLEGVGQLAGGVAHEFNNLLQVIEGYTRYGMEGLDPEEQRYDDLRQVLEAADRAAILTKQLLGFSRHKAIQLRSVDANDVVRDLAILLRPVLGKLITLQTLLGADVGEVYADAVDLQQALLNLCLNSRDAMPTGGIISIKTGRAAITDNIRSPQFDLQPGDYVVFSVSDTGAGIPRDVQPHIFEPFFTTKEVGKGTGLGLPMVYGMVRQHKGAIQVESEVGRGTTIKIYLPAMEIREAPDLSETDASLLGGCETILIVEDDPSTRYYVTRVLKRVGYAVLAAADGEEAIRLFDDHRENISLAVIDRNIPTCSSEEVYAHILDAELDVKFLFCSGVEVQREPAAGIGFENVSTIQKPFDPRVFLGKVRELLDIRVACPDNSEE